MKQTHQRKKRQAQGGSSPPKKKPHQDRWTALFLAARAGDQGQFATLVTESTGWLLARLRSNEHAQAAMRNAQDCEEVLQETFLRAWEKRHLYDPGQASVATWLLVLARNAAVMLLRQRNRWPALGLEDSAAEEQQSRTNNRSDPAESLITREVVQNLEEVLTSLPDPLVGQAVRLRLLEGKEFRQIQQQLGLSAASVLRWVVRVRTALWQRLRRSA